MKDMNISTDENKSFLMDYAFKRQELLNSIDKIVYFSSLGIVAT